MLRQPEQEGETLRKKQRTDSSNNQRVDDEQVVENTNTARAQHPPVGLLYSVPADVAPFNYVGCGKYPGLNMATKFTNCYDYATNSAKWDLGASPTYSSLYPENRGWDNTLTFEQWEEKVKKQFSPVRPSAMPGSVAERNEVLTGKFPDYSSRRVICWPMYATARDYHWAMEIVASVGGTVWVEQAGMGGNFQVWQTKGDLIRDVGTREYYLKWFEFDCRCDV